MKAEAGQVSGDSHAHVSKQGAWKVHTKIHYIHCLVPDLLQITRNPCYWGEMDPYEAEALVEGKPRRHSFAQALCGRGLPLLCELPPLQQIPACLN